MQVAISFQIIGASIARLPANSQTLQADSGESVIDDWRNTLSVRRDQGEPIVAGPNRDRAISKFLEVARPD